MLGSTVFTLGVTEFAVGATGLALGIVLAVGATGPAVGVTGFALGIGLALGAGLALGVARWAKPTPVNKPSIMPPTISFLRPFCFRIFR
jgi:hypothetical protein